MSYKIPFPEAFIELNKEVCNHPLLQKRIQKHHDTDPELQFSKCIAEICSYCNIAIDGHFTEPMLIKLADLCVSRLKDRRVELIETGSARVPTPALGLVDVSGNPIVKQ